MKVAEKYYIVLEEIGDWAIVSDWAAKVGEKYPDLLAKAEKEAASQKNETTGLREIAARISSTISRGAYSGRIEVDESERPRKVRALSQAEAEKYVEKEIEEDVAPITRHQRIKADLENLEPKEKYRLSELESIVSQLRQLFRLNFELEHANAIMNGEEPGHHHPDNIQIMTKNHNTMKSNSNWKRFSIDEQIDYIRAEVRLQKLVAERMGVSIDESILDHIFDRLKAVF